ncbi:TonB family protein [Granulicella sp. 5B5]|uniref:M56 family metallopeptidase n=1 Tax=Granulicella sp. 5B5 TaxID=1617967 RepID=UPI0015F67657|nr:M56 family metallopeptidase [Granulicella sp. 5B5]QMV19353.1 TonB family protein [Granulicella sp. 5B5]
MREFEAFVLTYLVNSLWQVPMVFATAWVAARLVRRLGPIEEHRAWCGGLLVAVGLPAIVTDVHAAALWAEAVSWFTRGDGATGRVNAVVGSGHAGGALRVSSVWVSAVVMVYAAVTAYFVARLVWGMWRARLLRRSAVAVPEEAVVRAAWVRHRRSFGVEDAVIAAVPDAEGPMTVGVFRRVLLLPMTWLGAVAEEDMEAAIAHECAHMQRRDFAKNLLYRVLTLPIAYHPATWMLQARVVETREMTCDAMASDAVAGRERYARSLLRLAENLLEGRRGQNIHAIGIFDANDFERRVMKLTMKRMEVGRVRRVVIAASCLALGMGTGASAMMLHMRVATPTATQDEGQGKTLPVKAGVMAGQIVSNVNPVYPKEARAQKIQGAVVLKAVIGKDGHVQNLEAVSGPDELRASALDAVKQWVFKPYLLNGNPVEVETKIEVNYSLAK